LNMQANCEHPLDILSSQQDSNVRQCGYEPIDLTNREKDPEKNSGGGDRTHDLSGMNRTLSPAELRRHKAPQAGFEPATDRLTADCSTTELLWNIGYNDALVFFTACSLLARRVKETPRRFACSFANCSTTELLWNVVCNDALAFLLLVVCWLVVSKRLLADLHVHLQIALPLSYCGILVIMMH